MERTNTKSNVLTPKEAAALYKVRPDTILELTKAGKIRGGRIGKLWRIDRASLEAYFESTSTQATQ
jgi:excisionase family DNA binding protein